MTDRDNARSAKAGKLGSRFLQRDALDYETASAANIENFIGTAKVPVGLAGPVLVHGEQARGEYHIPMATTEGTLVASTSRGMKIINQCGGVHVRVVRDGGIQRAPVFEFSTISDAMEFSQSLSHEWHWLAPVMEATTSHGKLTNVTCWQMGRTVCVRMTMNPGDASGQNMVSIAALKAVEALLDRFPSIKRYLMAGGLSGEKVPANINALMGRGKGVTAHVSIPEKVMRDVTRADIADLLRLHQTYMNFAMWGGNRNSHHSLVNTLAAMYIATGQDVACLPECAQAQNMLEHDAENRVLHWDVHMPNLNAGTVGGGTGLATQRECLEMMDCYGSGKINRFVELCAVTALANEISFWGAICSQEWVSAHADLRTRT